MCVSFPQATPGLGLRYPETQIGHQGTDRESAKRSLPVLAQGMGKASPNAQRVSWKSDSFCSFQDKRCMCLSLLSVDLLLL